MERVRWNHCFNLTMVFPVPSRLACVVRTAGAATHTSGVFTSADSVAACHPLYLMTKSLVSSTSQRSKICKTRLRSHISELKYDRIYEFFFAARVFLEKIKNGLPKERRSNNVQSALMDGCSDARRSFSPFPFSCADDILSLLIWQ